MTPNKWITGFAAAAGVGAIAAALAVRNIGTSVAERRSAADELQDPPEDIRHHQIPTHDGGLLHVADRGPVSSAAAPLVLLHGVTLQWWVWSAVMRLMGDHRRVIAWDMRGHGQSTAGSEGVTMAAIAADLNTMLTDLDLTDAVVVGHSMGGMALQRFAVDDLQANKTRVSKLVFLATSAHATSPLTIEGDTALASALGSGKLHLNLPDKNTNLNRATLRWAFGDNYTARSVEDLRIMMSEISPETMRMSTVAIATHDLREELRRVSTNAQIVTGTKDRVTPPRHARQLADLLDSDLSMVPNVGHQVMQEAPEQLSALLQQT